jgi:hypothetical protein
MHATGSATHNNTNPTAIKNNKTIETFTQKISPENRLTIHGDGRHSVPDWIASTAWQVHLTFRVWATAWPGTHAHPLDSMPNVMGGQGFSCSG